MAEEQKKTLDATTETEEELSILDEVLIATKIKPADEAYDLTKRGVEALIAQLIEPGKEVAKISKAVVDEMIAELDKKLSIQVDAILHHPEVQKLESAWRSLKYLIDNTDFRENIKVEILNVSKEDLQDDFEDAAEIVTSGLYKTAYTAEYGQHGGQPYAAIVGNYSFGPGPQDIKLLKNLASVGAMSHAPFIAAASEQMFGIEDFNMLPDLKDLDALFKGPQYMKWQSFRKEEDARYVALTLPRFLLRLPYGQDEPVKTFNYEENVLADHSDYLWGNAAFTFAARLTDSFAKYRWCANIIGPMGGGQVDDLVLHQYESMGSIQTKVPTEVLLSERREYELSEQGFIGLTLRKNTDNAAFFSANSVQQAKTFPKTKEGERAETNYKLGLQLPYMFVSNRLAHYLKVIQRENIGTWKERGDLEKELNTWITQYVADMENPAPEVKSRRPLRSAKVTVEDVPGEPGWYKVGLQVSPHFKYMGAFFTLSLVGKLDKK